MKKCFLSFAALSILSLGLSSCEKVKDALFPAFSTSGGAFVVNVPIVVNTSSEVSLGATTVHFNLDSTIKANTGGAFGLSNVDAVKIQDIMLDVLNDDATSNISNFESAKVTVTSSGNSTPAIVASATIPDVDNAVVIQGNGANLKPYLQSNEITYNVSGKARRATLKPLQLTLSITLRIE
jgi:hypothetical protein